MSTDKNILNFFTGLLQKEFTVAKKRLWPKSVEDLERMELDKEHLGRQTKRMVERVEKMQEHMRSSKKPPKVTRNLIMVGTIRFKPKRKNWRGLNYMLYLDVLFFIELSQEVGRWLVIKVKRLNVPVVEFLENCMNMNADVKSSMYPVRTMWVAPIKTILRIFKVTVDSRTIL